MTYHNEKQIAKLLDYHYNTDKVSIDVYPNDNPDSYIVGSGFFILRLPSDLVASILNRKFYKELPDINQPVSDDHKCIKYGKYVENNMNTGSCLLEKVSNIITQAIVPLNITGILKEDPVMKTEHRLFYSSNFNLWINNKFLQMFKTRWYDFKNYSYYGSGVLNPVVMKDANNEFVAILMPVKINAFTEEVIINEYKNL